MIYRRWKWRRFVCESFSYDKLPVQERCDSNVLGWSQRVTHRFSSVQMERNYQQYFLNFNKGALLCALAYTVLLTGKFSSFVA